MSSAGAAAVQTGDTGAQATAEAAAAAAAAAQAAAAQQAAWHAGWDADDVGVLQNRGLDKKTAPEATREMLKAHREATQMISRLAGTPDKDRILIQPKPDSPDAEKNAFYARLGRPDSADKYDFKTIKFPDGSDLDDFFVQTMRNASFKANLSADGARVMAEALRDYMHASDESEGVAAQAKVAESDRDLRKNWGPNYEPNMFVARQGALKAGFTAEEVNAFEAGSSKKTVMEAFLKVGKAFGEDKYIAKQAPGGTGAMTREQAKATLGELKMERGPDSFPARLARGDKKAKDQFAALTSMMVGTEG